MPTESLQRVKIPPPTECLEYDPKPSEREAPLLELWGVWSTPSLPLLPWPLWPGVVVLVKVLSMDQIELYDHLTMCKQITDVKLKC